MDIQKLLSDIHEKHGSDTNFLEAFQSDAHGTVLEHFGEEAAKLLKDNLDAGKIKTLVSGLTDKLDLGDIVSKLLK